MAEEATMGTFFFIIKIKTNFIYIWTSYHYMHNLQFLKKNDMTQQFLSDLYFVKPTYTTCPAQRNKLYHALDTQIILVSRIS